MIKGRKPIKRSPLRRVSKKTPAKIKKLLWPLLSRMVKERDGNKCVSCGATGLSGKNWHAGHLFSAGGHSATRWDPLNLASQCFRCNISLRGNAAEFSAWFIRTHGLALFSKLAAASKPTKKWTIPELLELVGAAGCGLANYGRFYRERNPLT